MSRQINFGGALIRQFGAYIRTDLTGLVDINGVATGVIGLIGLAEKGPVNQAVTITSYTQLVEVFGDGPLVRHGLAAYVGGANQLVCVRTGNPTAASLDAMLIRQAIGAPATTTNYAYIARERGGIGNNISISVSEQESGPVGPPGNEFIIRIRYVDNRGNDIRETFVLPRFIPARIYFDGDTGTNYYVLRDRETRIIREIPATWAYGNANLTQFLERVEQLKSTSEDLLGPFPVGAGNNPYPVALLASVINHGGLGYSPSELVMLTDATPSIEELLAGVAYDPIGPNTDVLLIHPPLNLAGGRSGDDGTNFFGTHDTVTGSTNFDFTYNVAATGPAIMAAWDASLAAMEDEDVNFVQPAYLFNLNRNSDGTLSNTFDWSLRYGFFKSLMPRFLAHINTMSNIQNRRFRTMVAGIPYYRLGTNEARTAQNFLDDIRDVSGLINNDRVQLWAGGFRSRAFSARVEPYGGEMLASFVVGAHAARQPAVSLTFARLAGIFTDGLEFAWNSAQKDELYARSLAFVMRRRNSAGVMEHIAAHNYTSFTGSASRGLQLFITRRIVDYMNSFVYKNLEENFIGRKSRGAETAADIADFVAALLNRLIREENLVTFANLRAFPDEHVKTIYYVEYDFQPVTEINFIPVTNRLLYNLA